MDDKIGISDWLILTGMLIVFIGFIPALFTIFIVGMYFPEWESVMANILTLWVVVSGVLVLAGSMIGLIKDSKV